MRGISRRTAYRFPVSADAYWQVTGDNAWHPARSMDLSATGIGLENTGPRLQVGDQIKLIVSGEANESGSTVVNSYSSSAGANHNIELAAVVTSEFNGHSNGKQRVGLLIQTFASKDDVRRYFESVYAPRNLLNGHEKSYKPLSEHIHQHIAADSLLVLPEPGRRS